MFRCGQGPGLLRCVPSCLLTSVTQTQRHVQGGECDTIQKAVALGLLLTESTQYCYHRSTGTRSHFRLSQPTTSHLYKPSQGANAFWHQPQGSFGAHLHRPLLSRMKGGRKVELMTWSRHLFQQGHPPPTVHPSLSGSAGGVKTGFFQLGTGWRGQQERSTPCGRVRRGGSASASSLCKTEDPRQVAGPPWRMKVMERNPRKVSTQRMSRLVIPFQSGKS